MTALRSFLPPPDALIVLGALIGRDGHPGRVARFRMQHALITLTQRFPHCHLIISGGRRPGTPCSEAAAMAGWGRQWWAQQAGAAAVDWDRRLVLEEQSRNTAEAARHAAQVLLARDWRVAGLITDGFHIRRACFLFARQFRRHDLTLIPLVAPGLLADYWRRRRYLRICKFTVREAGAWVKLWGREVGRRLAGGE